MALCYCRMPTGRQPRQSTWLAAVNLDDLMSVFGVTAPRGLRVMVSGRLLGQELLVR